MISTELVPFPAVPEALPALPPPAGPTFDLLAMICTGLAATSADGYRGDLADFATFVGAGVEPALFRLYRLAPGEANALALAYQAHMIERKLAAATIARRLAALRRAVNRARRVGLTSLSIEVDAPKAEAFRDTAGPGRAGWARMLAQAEADAQAGGRVAVRNLPILLLLHDRALRRGEVVALDWPDHVALERPAVAVLGKGKSSRELLTVNERTTTALARWIDVRGDWPGPLFVRADPAGLTPTRLTGESVNRMVQALARRVGLARTVRAHGLRHSAVTEALDGGWDVRDVKQFSRHARIDTVLIYDDRRKDIAGEITRGLGRASRRRTSAGK